MINHTAGAVDDIETGIKPPHGLGTTAPARRQNWSQVSRAQIRWFR
jgi:hypothetical protein